MRHLRLAYSLTDDTVERPGPNEPPTAFRIWKAGENRFDDGVAYFTEASAKLLLDEQAARSRPYCFDFSHLSLTSENPESGKAAGWHKLGVRDSSTGPELWAEDCSWVESVAKGMSAKVPEWRFFSPAFSVDSETSEIVSYTNCAVTNNPLTHDLPMLASMPIKASEEAPKASLEEPGIFSLLLLSGSGAIMDPVTALSILADPNASPEDRQAALDCLASLVAGMQSPAPQEEQQAAEVLSDDEEAKKASVSLAKHFVALSKKIEALEVAQLMAGKTMPSDVREWAMKQPTAVVKSFLASVKPNTYVAKEPVLLNSKSLVGFSDSEGFVPPPVGESPVDRVLGLQAPRTGKVGIGAVNKMTGTRPINPGRKASV